MSVKPVVGGRPVVHFALVIAALAGLMLVAGALDAALAQGGPFGAPRAQAPAPPMGGVLGWIFAKQAEFYRQFSSLIRAAKADGSVAWGLFGLSFLYGIFHAAGPGHGKAVISSYMLANEVALRRGILLSFISAFLQAFTAVAVMTLVFLVLRGTAISMTDSTWLTSWRIAVRVAWSSLPFSALPRSSCVCSLIDDSGFRMSCAILAANIPASASFSERTSAACARSRRSSMP